MTKLTIKNVGSGAVDGTAIADGTVDIIDISSAAMGTLRAAATQNADGLLTSSDKTKLDRLNFPVANLRLVSKGGSDTVNLGTGAASAPFLTIGAALASISGNTATNHFLVLVDPGLYQEHTLVVPDYVSLAGTSIYSTILEPLSATEHMIDAGSGTEIGFLTIQNVGEGYAAITQTRAAEYALVHKVSMENCDIGCLVDATNFARDFYAEIVDMNGTYTHAVKVLSDGTYDAFCDLENVGTYPTSENTTAEILLDGSTVSATIISCSIGGNTFNNGLTVTNGAQAIMRSTIVADCVYAIHAPATGNNPVLSIGGTGFRNCTYNLYIANTTASGNFTGYAEYAKIIIDPACSFFVTNKDAKIYTVAKKGGDFISIAEACNHITDSDSTNRYVVTVGPGVYSEPLIDVPAYVSVVGDSIQTVIVQPAAANQHLFNLHTGCEISFLTCQGVGAGYAAIYAANAGDFTQCHKVSFIDCDTGIDIRATTAISLHYAEYVDFNGTFSCAGKAYSDGFTSLLNLENVYTFVTSCTGIEFSAEGPDAALRLSNGVLDGDGTCTGVEPINGASAELFGMHLQNHGIALHTSNSGANAPSLQINGATIVDSATYDVLLEYPLTTGFFVGIADRAKVSCATSTGFSMSYTGPDASGFTVLKELYQGGTQAHLINLSKVVRQGTMVGLVSGGAISAVTGRVLAIAAGTGFVLNKSSSPYYLQELSWAGASVTISANSEAYIYVDTSNAVTTNSTRPDTQANILLGRAYADTSDIDFFVNAPFNMVQYANRNEDMLQNALGPIFGTGCIVSANATPLHLDVGSGAYYYGNVQFAPTGGTDVTWEEYYRKSGGGWNNYEDVNVIDTTKYDDGSGTLATMTAGYYAKHSLYLSTNGTADKYFLVYSQTQYSTIQLAQGGNIPTQPSWLKNSVVLVATIITLNGASSITQITDERPRLGFQPSSVTAITVHDSLSGRDTDGHTQYLKADGTRNMAGALNMGTYNITNVGTVDGVTVSGHVSRHLPTGADALTTAAPTTALSTVTTNAAGSANSLSRSDHTHAVSFPAQVFHNVQFDDFTASTLVAAASAMSWVALASNGGTAAMDVNATTDNTYNGRVLVATGTTNNSSGKGGVMAYNNVNKLIPVCATGGKTAMEMEWRVRLPVLSGTGAITYTTLVGMGDVSTAGLPTNGIFFAYTNTVNSGQWVCTTRAGGSSSDITVGTPTVVANTWYKLKVTIDSSNVITFFIDGVSMGTSAGNKPTVACRPMATMEKSSSATTSRVLDVDYFSLYADR